MNTNIKKTYEVLKCKHCGYTTKDMKNLSGVATRHLINNHGLHEKYNLHFTNELLDEKQTLSCPICNWKTYDLVNKTGVLTTHIQSHMEIQQFIDKHNDYRKYFNTQIGKINKNKELEDDFNSIECKLCNKKFYKLTVSHLKLHNTTPKEYKIKFNIKNTSSLKITKVQQEKSNDPVIKEKMIKSLLATNNRKFGANSYTQTEHGRENVKHKTFINTYNKYTTSPILSSHVELLFGVNEYKGNKDQTYKILCKKCNNIFDGKLENGRIPRCFNCYPKINKGYSEAELELSNYIADLGVQILRNYKINGVEVDIFIPSKNIAVEYDGLHWHSELNGKDKTYHLNKTKICEQSGIQLIHVFEDEWVYKTNIVKSRLKKMLVGAIDNKIYAKDCVLTKINKDERDLFFEFNHLQGHDNSDKNHSYGLLYNNELVSVMTFMKNKYVKSNDVYELSRFSSKLNIVVVGGFSKLLSHFVSSNIASKIITFADRRWSTENNVYIKNGFGLIGYTEPSYWYIKNHQKRYHRFGFRRKRLKSKISNYNSSLTEWQNMQLNGYDRIWDCGNLKYELVVK